jgi:branched-chain amino acid transport system ATP-binding protein
MPILSIQDLRVRVGGSHILQGVGFDVAASGTTVLLGRNGVGKTTTLKAVLGLMPAGTQIDGTVAFAGRAVTRQATYRLIRQGLGYVPEDRGVFGGLTVAENLRLAERQKPADYDTVYALFPELAKRARQRAGTLSGGQQQMVALGRVLLNHSRLLLIDEPTKGLAPKVVTEVADVLERVAQTVPVLLVEQNLAVVRRLGRDAVVLAAGQVAFTGPLSSLLESPERAQALLGVGQVTVR